MGESFGKERHLTKAILGLLTFWSPVFVVALVFWLLRSGLLSLSNSPNEAPVATLVKLLAETLVVVALGALTLVILSITTLVYAVHIIRNTRLTETKKVLWSLVNVTLGPFAMPVYWLLYF